MNSKIAFFPIGMLFTCWCVNAPLLVTVTAALSRAEAATPRTIYVDGALSADCTSGNYSVTNRNRSGSDGNAYITIPSGIRAMASGDMLMIRAGTYTGQGFAVGSIPSGTAAAYTTISRYGSEAVVLATSPQAHQIGGFGAQSYIVIDGLTFNGAYTGRDDGQVIWIAGDPENGYAGPDGLGSHHLVFRNCEMYGNTANGFILQRNTSDILIRNCSFHDQGGKTSLGQGQYPIYNEGRRLITEYCHFRDIRETAIKYGESTSDRRTDGGIIRNNLIHDFAIDSTDPIHFGAPAIQFSVYAQNIQVYNNVIYNNRAATNVESVYIWMYNTSGAIDIFNNTIYNTHPNACAIFQDTTIHGGAGAVIKNNIFRLGNGPDTVRVMAGAPTPTYGSNLCERVATGCAIVGSPQFINPAAGDLHLQTGSAAIDRGMSIATVAQDKDGVSRPQGAGYDIGAYEYRSSAANLAPTAVASASQTSGTAPLPVFFNGSSSFDHDGAIASYFWNFGDGSSGSGATTSHTYTSAGRFSATLTVTDNTGAAGSTSLLVVVSNRTVNSTLQATDLGITGEDKVGPINQTSANGIADFHLSVSGLRGTPSKVTITSDTGGVWEKPFNGANWIIATSVNGSSGDFWFEPWTSRRFHVKVSYPDGTTDEADAPPITFREGLAQGGFENPALRAAGQSNGFQYQPTGSAWTFTSTAGISANGSGFTSGNSAAPDGVQVAFLQGDCSVSQNVVMKGGTYTISLQCAQRRNWQSSFQFLSVAVDGTIQGVFLPGLNGYELKTTASFQVADGSHRIEISGLNLFGGDNTAFIDQVSLTSSGMAMPSTKG